MKQNKNRILNVKSAKVAVFPHFRLIWCSAKPYTVFDRPMIILFLEA